MVGSVPDTPIGHLTMLKLPDDDFVTIELVFDPTKRYVEPGPGPHHFVVKVESLDETIAELAAGGVEAEPPTSPDGSDDFRTTWITDRTAIESNLSNGRPTIPTASPRPTGRTEPATAGRGPNGDDLPGQPSGPARQAGSTVGSIAPPGGYAREEPAISVGAG